MGAMVFGRIQKERIALNESSFWSGRPRAGKTESLPRVILNRYWGNRASYGMAKRPKLLI
jgi:hypothetical protein